MCLKTNEFQVTVLEDGTVKVETGSVGGPEHMAAERFLVWLAEQLGGGSTRTRLSHGHVHEHAHGHDHEHDEVKH